MSAPNANRSGRDQASPDLRTGAKPPKQDPAHPEFWESRYREGVTPWDRGAAPADFLAWLDKLSPPQRVLIPGCGSAYEVGALAAAGHEVEAIDYSPAAVARAKAQLGTAADRVREADFFALATDKLWTYVYERAFLCALPPRLWPDYARRMGELIAPGGALCGYFYLSPETGRGPPFPIDDGHLIDLLNPWFERRVDHPARDSLPVFGQAERWQVWQRKPCG